jgi:hypothetical protein
MNRKYLGYSILIIAGLILMLLIVRNRSAFGKRNTSFAAGPGTEITGIDLMKGKSVVKLKKKGDEWSVNGEKEARKSAILFITRILGEITIKSPVSGEIFASEVLAKNVEPVRVNVYENRRIVRSFYVYKTKSNIYGNIMKVRPDSKPFIVYMPGYEDDIGNYFIADERFWLPFAVFRLLPSEIRAIETDYPGDAEASFTITNSGNRFVLSDRTGMLTGYDTMRVRRYVSYFTSVSFESWAYEIEEAGKEKARSEQPFARITVRKVDGGETVLTMRYILKNINGEEIRDTDRLWGSTGDGGELFIMRYFDADPVLKKKAYFFGM